MNITTIDGIVVSDICLGTMYFGTMVPESVSLRLLDIYAEAGGNFLDSANKYASWVPGFYGGESERIIGKWLKGKARDQYVITSKVGFPYGKVPRSLKAREIVQECEKSLKRLGCDYIDFYFAHTQDEETPIEESLQAFDSLIQSGKIRLIGASNYDVWRLAESDWQADRLNTTRYRILQQRYSLLQPVLGADFGTQKVLSPEHIDYCNRHNIHIMAYSPLLGGLYEQQEPDIPIQYQSQSNLDRLKLLHRFACERECTPNQLVIGWMRAQTPSILPIVTSSSEAHLRDNLQETEPENARVFAKVVFQQNRFNVKY